MRGLLGLVLLAAAAWSSYWIIGARGAEAGFAAWFEERRGEGWQADYADMGVRGFPNRFDATFTDVSLADPGTGLSWEAPFFQLLALSYRPNHVIAIWPGEQRVTTPEDKFTLTTEDMRASLVLEANTGLTLDRATLAATGLSISPEAGPGNGPDAGGAPLAAQALTLAADRVPADADAQYHLGLRAEGVAPAAAWLERVDPRGALPKTLESVTADFTVVFDRPWDRRAIEVVRPQPREIKLKLAEARWGQLSLQAAGAVRVDASGQPEGSITIKAQNWREILQLARSSGAISESFARPLENALGLMAGLAGNPATLDIPLDLRGGRVWLGPVPIGPAPVLRLR